MRRAANFRAITEGSEKFAEKFLLRAFVADDGFHFDQQRGIFSAGGGREANQILNARRQSLPHRRRRIRFIFREIKRRKRKRLTDSENQSTKASRFLGEMENRKGKRLINKPFAIFNLNA